MRLLASATWRQIRPQGPISVLGGRSTSRTLATSTFRHNSSLTSTAPRETGSKSSLFRPTPAVGGEGVKPFYITTPIFYVNACHLHTLVLSDVIARYSRLRYPDRPVLFATGTDEHGLKIQQAAKKGGVDEQTFCDQVSQRFRDLASKANISHTTFIRTSSPEHYTAVENFWARLVAAGDIYKGTHSGWYSISDECFYSSNQVTKADDGKVYANETGNEVTREEEENWKFRLGSFREKLLDWASQEGAVQPDLYQNDILRQLPNLEDLSISRPASRVKWGVPVPSDPEQTIYVWVDALINYITVLGYPNKMDGWPADVHVVGKDIIRFHAIHWPALLMSANLSPPRHILAHAHWTMAKSKMSKSRGNVIDPITSMDKWGVDGVRWYLMRAGGGLPVDADYSSDELAVSYRQLSDQIGNLLSRISSPRLLSKLQRWTPGDQNPDLDAALDGLRGAYETKMEEIGISKACEGIMDIMVITNRLVTQLAPWSKSATSSNQAIIYAYHALRISAILLQPVLPSKAAELLDRLGVDEGSRGWEMASWHRGRSREVDVQDIKTRLEGADERWKGKGPLFPPVSI